MDRSSRKYCLAPLLKDYLLEDIMPGLMYNRREKYDENSAILSQTSMNSYTSNIALTLLTGVERSPKIPLIFIAIKTEL